MNAAESFTQYIDDCISDLDRHVGHLKRQVSQSTNILEGDQLGSHCYDQELSLVALAYSQLKQKQFQLCSGFNAPPSRRVRHGNLSAAFESTFVAIKSSRIQEYLVFAACPG
jgi:hypothetical protein